MVSISSICFTSHAQQLQKGLTTDKVPPHCEFSVGKNVQVKFSTHIKLSTVPVIIAKIKRGDTVKTNIIDSALYKSLARYIDDTIHYPESEKEAIVNGTVQLSFIIEKDSTVSNIKCVKGVQGGPGLDKNALSIIERLPKLNPYREKGHYVKAVFEVAIQYSVKFKYI